MPQHTIAVMNGSSRTFSHLIPQALAKGHKVHAIVRSASRFLATAKKHDDLSVYEWNDFHDLATLGTALDGVDTVYVAYGASGTALLSPSWLNANAVVSITTVLRERVPPGERSPTRVILLVSYATRPGEPRHALAEAMIGHQFNDLRAAQDVLLKQAGWLDYVFVAPGSLVDSETSDDKAAVTGVALTEGGVPPRATSYTRLAAAMRLAAVDPRWVGKFATPMPTTAVPDGFKYRESARETIWIAVTHQILPPVLRAVAVSLAAGALGYAIGVRDQGALARRWLGFTPGS